MKRQPPQRSTGQAATARGKNAFSARYWHTKPFFGTHLGTLALAAPLLTEGDVL